MKWTTRQQLKNIYKNDDETKVGRTPILWITDIEIVREARYTCGLVAKLIPVVHALGTQCLKDEVI